VEAISRIAQMEYISIFIISLSSATIIDWEDFKDPFNGASAILSLILTISQIILPFYNIIKIVINFDNLREKRFKK
jgi:hypothetical protein